MNAILDADRILFQSQSYEFNRIHTSHAFAEKIGLEGIPMPFYFLLAHAATMSHVDSSKHVLDAGYSSKSPTPCAPC